MCRESRIPMYVKLIHLEVQGWITILIVIFTVLRTVHYLHDRQKEMRQIMHLGSIQWRDAHSWLLNWVNYLNHETGHQSFDQNLKLYGEYEFLWCHHIALLVFLATYLALTNLASMILLTYFAICSKLGAKVIWP